MKQGDHEHTSFHRYASDKGMDVQMHPLHLLYLTSDTAEALRHFEVGYTAGKAAMAGADTTNIVYLAKGSLTTSDDPAAQMYDLVTKRKCDLIACNKATVTLDHEEYTKVWKQANILQRLLTDIRFRDEVQHFLDLLDED